MTTDPALLHACYRSGQIPEAAWQEHLQSNASLRDWLSREDMTMGEIDDGGPIANLDPVAFEASWDAVQGHDIAAHGWRALMEKAIGAYLSACLPDGAAGLVGELRSPVPGNPRVRYRAAAFIQSQAARIAELEAEIERMTPKFVAYDYLESPAGRGLADGWNAAGAQGMSRKPVFGEPERVEVRLDGDDKPTFFFSSRDGWENLGPELRMAADSYAIGTKITLEEPLDDH